MGSSLRSREGDDSIWEALHRLALCVGIALILGTGCRPIGYIITSGIYQAELLLSREPVSDVIASGELSDSELSALATIEDVRGYGVEIGLADTESYQAIAVDWDHTIYIVSACEPLSFEAHTWWFPIVGRVPYLGFFEDEHAIAMRERLQRHGYVVSIGEAAAYSTLGWFRDPVLPTMLRWSEHQLADLILHELTHATVWIPGSVAFNESLANYVGETAALQYLSERYGSDSAEVASARASIADGEQWRLLLHGVYEELDDLYDSELDDADKVVERDHIFAGIAARVGSQFLEPDRYRRAAENTIWNNARLIRFRTYNNRRPLFDAVMVAAGADVVQFLSLIEAAVDGADDPYDALEAYSASLP